MKLISITDLRQTDTDGTKQLLLEQGNICDRCGKEHVVVYEIEDNEGKIYRVGSTCCKKMLGWTPDAGYRKVFQKAEAFAEQHYRMSSWPTMELAQWSRSVCEEDRALFRELGTHLYNRKREEYLQQYRPHLLQLADKE